MLTKLIKAFDLYVMSPKIAIAVSGGLDSMVLMNLANISKKIKSENIHIIVIDHNLRKGSKEEALFVKEEASKLGFKSVILTWKGKRPLKNIQSFARKIRFKLLYEKCDRLKIKNILLGHHSCLLYTSPSPRD